MAAPSGFSPSLPTLPPPRPKSPPDYPDLYGKRRGMAKVQMLEREIGFLEDELKSAQSLQPASRCCTEIADYVVENSDPFIPTNRKNHRTCRLWKWLCGMPCFNLSWICCCCSTGCSFHLEMPRCCCDSNPCKCGSCVSCCSSCDCNPCTCGSCVSCCHFPKWCCCACPRSHCCKKVSCSRSCCNFPSPSCPDCSCCIWRCTRPKCPKVRPCCCCTKTCCNPCYLCY
ncbi:guanine nucleotide-binding protein subunit gamma 3-like [Juglans microcarpa x Juglans regia]|uniref:guanine nucleotide-binding protein subunit gamma 3-like n=1 Tax=Juglans microcarpa x Juglans regia TaxID=2249226 RepID=UPI001B7E273E|nr:guanine nucleotide-binding protein subunit gamma 3-like [Juglans microcarpa x Juglans regia]